MGHEHTLWPARCAAGVDDGAEVIRTHVRGFERRRLERVGEREVVVADVVGTEAEQREIRILRLELAGALGEVVGVEDEALDLGIGEHVGVVGE